MKTKITKRDVAIFFLGIFAMLFIDLVWDWNSSVDAFKDGWKDGQTSVSAEISE